MGGIARGFTRSGTVLLGMIVVLLVGSSPANAATISLRGAYVNAYRTSSGALAVYVKDTAADGQCARAKVIFDVPGPDVTKYSYWACGNGTTRGTGWSWQSLTGLRGARVHACRGSSTGVTCTLTYAWVPR